jgi:hypothetical protein
MLLSSDRIRLSVKDHVSSLSMLDRHAARQENREGARATDVMRAPLEI